MKKFILNIAVAALFGSALFACNDWTEPEREDFYKAHGDEYYANLRAYKKTDHAVTFGWFGNWTGKGASLQGSLMGLPDSVDFVSMWGNWHSLTADKIADKNEVKRLKGTRVMMCFIIANIGDQTTPPAVRTAKQREEADGTTTTYYEANGVEYSSETAAVRGFWGWPTDESSETAAEEIDAAIRKYANSIVDTIDKYDWDGFDFDLECHYGSAGNIASYKDRLGIIIDEFGKYLGPTSGTDRLLCVDGEPFEIPREEVEHINYYILQAYYCASYTNLDSRLNSMINAFEGVETSYGVTLTAQEITRRTIFCEDFEKAGYAVNGGFPTFTTRDGRKVPSLLGMAGWEPSTGVRHGGIGTYHMEYDYTNNPEYKWLRQATGIMNPVIK